MTALPTSQHATTAPATSDVKTVLIVDDSKIARHLMGRQVEKIPGHKTCYAKHGLEALEMMEKQAPHAVLTDLLMPVMDGLALVRAIREKYPFVPVVLVTGAGSDEIAIQALHSGAASYVNKSNLERDLASTLQQVVANASLDRARLRLLMCLNQRESRFRLENDPVLIPPLVEMLLEELAGMGLCDETACTRVGVALEHALLNALYHGNLELGSSYMRGEEKEIQRIVEERRKNSIYSNRRIHMCATLVPTEARYVICDEGRGFDTSTLPNPADPASLEQKGGRGLLLIQTFMDKVTYAASGSQVILVKYRDENRNSPA